MFKKNFIVLAIFVASFLIGTIVFAQSGIVEEEQDFRFAQQLADKGMYDIAAIQFSRFTELYPTSLRAPEALLHAAESYEKTDSTFKAADIYLSLLLRYPQSPLVDQALYNRAGLLAIHDDFLVSALAFERIKLIAPESDLVPAAQISAGEQFIAAGELQKALNALYFLLEDYPTHPLRLKARYLIAKVRKDQGRLDLALQELDKISSEKLGDDLMVNAALLRSQLYSISGRQTKSDSILWNIVKSPVKNDSVASAALRLAINLQKIGDYKNSNEAIKLAQKNKPGIVFETKLNMTQGDNFYLLGDYNVALKNYLKITYQELPLELKIRASIRRGFVQKKVGNKEEAIRAFKSIFAFIDSTDISEFHVVSQQLLIETAHLLSETGQPLDALNFIRDNIDKIQPNLRDEIIFAMAEIQENGMNDYVGAGRTFSTLLTLYPKSNMVDDAQNGLARCADKQENSTVAIAEYSRYLSYFPGADDYPDAEKRLDYLKKFAPAELYSADRAFNDLFSTNMVGGNSAGRYLKWAERQIDTFHDYQKALHFLKQALVSDGKENLDKPYILYQISQCHSLLAEKNRLNGKSTQMQAHLDSANTTYKVLTNNFSSTKWVTIAIAGYLDEELKQKESLIGRVTLIDSLIRTLRFDPPLDTLKDELELKLAQEIISVADDSATFDLWDRANNLTQNVIDKNGPGQLYGNALLLGAVINHNIAKTDTAIVLLENYIRNFPNAQPVVQAFFNLADFYEQQGELAKAVQNYNVIREKYFYSDYAEKAIVRMSRILIRMGRINEAKILLSQLIQTSIPEQDRMFFNRTNNHEAFWLWTQTHIVSQDNLAAMDALRQFIEYNSKSKYKRNAMLDLAERAHKEYKDDIALGYYEEIARTGTDSLANVAMVEAADIYFDKSEFNLAKGKYSSLKKRVVGDLLNHVSLQEVLCEYKLENENIAQSLAKSYEKNFKDKNGQAKILYEEGMYNITKKNFKTAEKVFKKLADDYKDVPEGPRGELGLARLYVILTRTDDALNTLTNITTKYTNPEIVATAYLNLADFYYENRQTEPCILAAKKVLSLMEHGKIRAQAMDLLIESYDNIRFWDRAIALQREYIRLYPDSPNLMNRKVRIGIFLFNLKEYQRAIAQLRDLKPLADAETEPEIQYWIARSYSEDGETEKAIIEYLKVKYLSKPTKLPWGVSALYEAGLGYKKLGNYDKAIDLLEQVVRERGATDNMGAQANFQIGEIRELLKKS